MPQRLKPCCGGSTCGTAEAVSLTKRSGSNKRVGLRPRVVSPKSLQECAGPSALHFCQYCTWGYAPGCDGTGLWPWNCAVTSDSPHWPKIDGVLPSIQRARLAVVLVRARNPGNIGAAARAMHDFGFGDLRLVNPYPVPLEAARSAIDASAVLHSAQSHATLAEALADCTLVLGTTAVGERDLQHPLESLAAAASRITAALGTPEGSPGEAPPRVALLFGSEKTGLSNEELSHCHSLLTIPMHLHSGLRHPSMNLGQAVAVCLYELVRERPVPPRGPAEILPAAPYANPTAQMQNQAERLRDLLSDVLESSGYRQHHPRPQRRGRRAPAGAAAGDESHGRPGLDGYASADPVEAPAEVAVSLLGVAHPLCVGLSALFRAMRRYTWGFAPGCYIPGLQPGNRELHLAENSYRG